MIGCASQSGSLSCYSFPYGSRVVDKDNTLIVVCHFWPEELCGVLRIFYKEHGTSLLMATTHVISKHDFVFGRCVQACIPDRSYDGSVRDLCERKPVGRTSDEVVPMASTIFRGSARGWLISIIIIRVTATSTLF